MINDAIDVFGDVDVCDEPFVTVRYNHKDVELNRNEAVELAQKGLNYDKLSQRLDAAGEVEDLSYLDNLVISLGFESRKELADALKNEAESLSSEDKPSEDDGLFSFFEKYPQVNASDIPEDVISEYAKGVPLISAYEKHTRDIEVDSLKKELDQLREKQRIIDANSSNSQSSAGSVTVGGNAAAGEFFTENELGTLPGDVLKKNLDKALSSMSFWSAKRR